MKSFKDEIIIWDDKEKSAPISKYVICWNSYNNERSNQSVLDYIETNSDQLRSKFLSYIHEFGELKIFNKRLIDHLEIDNGFSFWWMTLIAEKSYLKSPRFLIA